MKKIFVTTLSLFILVLSLCGCRSGETPWDYDKGWYSTSPNINMGVEEGVFKGALIVDNKTLSIGIAWQVSKFEMEVYKIAQENEANEQDELILRGYINMGDDYFILEVLEDNVYNNQYSQITFYKKK